MNLKHDKGLIHHKLRIKHEKRGRRNYNDQMMVSLGFSSTNLMIFSQSSKTAPNLLLGPKVWTKSPSPSPSCLPFVSFGFELKNPPLWAQNGLKIHPKPTSNVATSCSNVATSGCSVSATSRRWFSTSRRCCSPLFLLQLRKAITLSYELRFGCSWYR